MKLYKVNYHDLKRDLLDLMYYLLEIKIIYLDNDTHLKEIKVIDEQELIIPNHITVEITNSCQLKCIHCFNSYDKIRKRKIKFIKYSDLSNFFSFCKGLNVQSVFLTGGEPLLHKKINEIVKKACDCFSHVTLATNGFVKIKDDLLSILSLNNTTVQISIDGNESYHDKFRGVRGSYKSAIDNIIALIKHNVDTQVSYSLHKNNLQYLTEQIMNFKRIGISSFNIGSISNQGNALENKIDIIEIKKYMNIVSNLYKKYSDKNFTVGSNVNESKIRRIYDEIEYDNKCGAGYRTIHIDSDFNVLPCQAIDIKIGKIVFGYYKKIMSYRTLRKFLNIISPTPSNCSGCSEGCGWMHIKYVRSYR